MVKFDVVVGNPPYQGEAKGDNKNYSAPIYPDFMDSAYSVADKAMLITPGRFLFNAGGTRKAWNKKMLNDEHIKVVYYEQDSSNIFPNVGIAGGVAITYRDRDANFGAIELFTSSDELNKITQRVGSKQEPVLTPIISGRGIYRLTPKSHEDYPQIKEIQSKGHQNDIGTGAFNKFNNLIYFDEIPNDGYSYTLIHGRFANNRTQKYIRSEYVNEPFAFDKWRVILPKVGPTAKLIIGEPFVIGPHIGFTETYISIGEFESESMARNALKYIKSRFARTMLSVLKVTQDNTKEKWSKVPLQDFTKDSDIDWSKSIAEIDQQLYEKYGLSEEEITFIETHVKEME